MGSWLEFPYVNGHVKVREICLLVDTDRCCWEAVGTVRCYLELAVEKAPEMASGQESEVESVHTKLEEPGVPQKIRGRYRQTCACLKVLEVLVEEVRMVQG